MSAVRGRIAFRAVNRPRAPDYDAGLQRHHLLPRQLLTQRCFAALFAAVPPASIGYDDFRRNGLLLPANTSAAICFGLPLHRGPHRNYNAMVIERVGQIERGWASRRPRDPAGAREEAAMRMALLQGGLRRRLLDPTRPPLTLNRHTLVSAAADFTELDAMAETLWGATSPP